MSQLESERREWWVFYIDPREPQDSRGWKVAGVVGGPGTADEAIATTVGRKFDQPFWAFALNRGDFGAYYELHYPPGYEGHRPQRERRLGPAGYRAVGTPDVEMGTP